MKRNTRLPGAARTGLAAIGLVLVTSVWSHFAVAQDAPLTETDRKQAEQKKPDYSPYPDQHFPTRVFWGDTHHHTRLSFDSGLMGAKLGPEEAYRFARGEKVMSNTGQRPTVTKARNSLPVIFEARWTNFVRRALASIWSAAKNSVSFVTVLSHGSALAVSSPSLVDNNPMPSYHADETATSSTISPCYRFP